MATQEINFDGLVGPTHHFGGLSFGNMASESHAGEASNPREAALQGLAKMRALADLGIPQAVLPPHLRPELELARRLGFRGNERAILEALASDMPLLLAACYSASSMWTANAATVSPSHDTEDGKLHFTPANLQNKVHRSIEPGTTARILRAIFQEPEHFVHHEPLPATAALGDEGAANHTRFSRTYGDPGVELFVYGESAANPWGPRPKIFPSRQMQESSEAIARLHRLEKDRVVFAQQNPEVIDRGVFHNDVISVGNLNLFLFHEEAFLDTRATLANLESTYRAATGEALQLLRVTTEQLPVELAVMTYLFNSQLVERPNGAIALVAPKECEETAQVRDLIASWVEGSYPIDEVHFFDLRQSMFGGGGPACLRLRVWLTDAERKAMSGQVLFTPALDKALVAWVSQHYRDQLYPADLKDPALLDASRRALDELTGILGLGSVYAFQQA
jgi:succinylarginine dihydrolase